MLSTLFLLAIFGLPIDPSPPQVLGLEWLVKEPQAAADFFKTCLDFEVLNLSDQQATLTKDGILLRMVRSERLPDRHDTVYLNFSVENLSAATEKCLIAGGELLNEDLMQSQIGPFNGIRVPGSNHRIHLMQINAFPEPEGVFNTSFRVADMAKEEHFYTSLGLTIYSRDFLPETLPFNRAGMLSLVIHPFTAGQRPRAAATRLLVQKDPSLWSALQGAGYDCHAGTCRSPSGYALAFIDLPAGYKPPTILAEQSSTSTLD